MIRLGTSYGGWTIPKDNSLDKNSIIYSLGVGEDVSFDLSIQNLYGSNIILIDPTTRAKYHYLEISNFIKSKKWAFKGNIQPDYKSTIVDFKNVDLNKIKYIDLGVWNEKTELQFYKQHNKNNVSQSLITNMFGDEYDIVNVDTLKNIMKRNNHTKIDLLKMDIEGAEIKVLNNMLDDGILPKYLCVEFDLYIKQKDYNNETKNIINRLVNHYNYSILTNEDMNITFVKK